MPQTNYSGGYKLRKRNRNDEENITRKHRPWTKSILDVEANKILGHTPLGWLKLLVFYLIFGLVLALFTWLYFFLLVKFAYPEDSPLYTRKQPGLSSAPYSIRKDNKIEYYEDVMQEIDPYLQQIESFLELDEEVENTRFKDCNTDSVYGYRTRQPCVFVKLNRLNVFKTNPYKHDAELPLHAPTELKSLLKSMDEEKEEESKDNRIWLSCENSDGSDEPEIQYVPEPFWNSDDLMSDKPFRSMSKNSNGTQTSHTVSATHKRIIGVKLLNTPVDKDVSIFCSVWARNVKIDCTEHGAGWTSFKLNIKKPTEGKQQANRM